MNDKIKQENDTRLQDNETCVTEHIPQVSVCMPMYNASKYLRECIDSVLAQTFKDFEFLIVDDGSDDDSVEIVKSYHDDRIRLIENTHDYIGSLNILLDKARGKYIARMDADDIMRYNRLSIQYKFLENEKNIDIVCGEIEYLGNEKRTIVAKEFEVTLDAISGGNIIPHPTVMMRTNSIREKSLRYNPEYIFAEDYNLWVDALIAGLRIIKLSQVLISYRICCTQISQQKREEQKLCSAKVLQKIYSHLYPSVFEKDIEYLKNNINKPELANKLTIIIPFLNEQEEVVNTLKSIRDKVGDQVEIIIIDDCSDDGWSYESLTRPFNVSYVKNNIRMGVAASRDLGVCLCRTPYFLLLDAHMRFYDEKWPGRLVSLLDKDDRVVICCQTRFLTKNETNIVVHNTECPNVFGAFSTFSVDNYWPDIEWSLNEQQKGQNIEFIGNILGAGYAASKRYWSYIKGLNGLRKYGCDEAFLSFKVWREGGKCLLVKDVIIGHIYRTTSPYKHYVPEEISNNLLVSYLVFSQSYYCYAMAIALQKDRELYYKSMRILQLYGLEIESLKKYLDSIYTKAFDDVLQIHRCRLYDKDATKKHASLYHQINKFILDHPSKKLGLFEGVTGQLLWFCLYNKWSNGKNLDDTIQSLWKEICDAVKSHSLSWNFSQGIAGIGWACMYMYTRQLLDNYPESILHEIDLQIQEIDLNKVPISDFAMGAGGVLAYITLRETTGHPNWDSSYLDILKIISQKIIENPHSDLPSIFYAIYFLDMQKNGIEKNTYHPKISEWLLKNQHIPSNIKYWEPTIFNGCIGAVIGLIDHECNTKNKPYV